ncbi:hypothetical protein EV180_001141 [Coemansia sp. RSA 518]|nr:hypothetical protein EV180_001141 [Coemansia sp. RSA 518]
MVDKMREFTRTCHNCQLSLARAPPIAGQGVRAPADIGQHVYIDHGHVGSDGVMSEKHFLVMVDQVSGYIAAAAVQNRSAVETTAALHNFWIRPFGPPATLTSDNAREFQSHHVQTYLGKMGIKFQASSGYNPQANIAETAVKKVKEGLRRALTDARYGRPYLVKQQVSDTNYELADLHGRAVPGKVHGRWLEPYYPPDGGIPSVLKESSNAIPTAG